MFLGRFRQFLSEEAQKHVMRAPGSLASIDPD
jgi:hypothetical protein